MFRLDEGKVNSKEGEKREGMSMNNQTSNVESYTQHHTKLYKNLIKKIIFSNNLTN